MLGRLVRIGGGPFWTIFLGLRTFVARDFGAARLTLWRANLSGKHIAWRSGRCVIHMPRCLPFLAVEHPVALPAFPVSIFSCALPWVP